VHYFQATAVLIHKTYPALTPILASHLLVHFVQTAAVLIHTQSHQLGENVALAEVQFLHKESNSP